MRPLYRFSISFSSILIIYFSVNYLIRSSLGFGISTDIVRLLFSVIVFYFGIKYRLFKKDFIKSNLVPTLIFVFIVCILSLNYVVNEMNTHSTFDNKRHWLFIISSFAPGLFEELFFRLFLFAGLYKYLYKLKIDKFNKTVVLTSLIFALAHSINFSSPEYVQLSVVAQILFAFGVGLFLQSVFIRFRNILIPITLHGIINYLGMYKTQLIQITKTTRTETYTFQDLIMTLTIFAAIIILFVLPITYISLKHKKKWHNIMVTNHLNYP